jgi:hypothetical protein
MIRWYDWAAAVFVADWIVASAIASVTAAVWWQSALSVALVYMLFVLWDDWCQWRLERERTN